MSRARLRELRLVGFKSFAERTVVPLGAGISAVVGPNGSGKSNLADALRWTLGEQGRALRTRRAEDVIFAGSASRRAVGMADVSLLIDNEDRLLPVDFGEVELSRRLYRSGENEYLINRQRIRLRDLVDLLDDANIADNAFLFIGQGMVDQALALRPEERRPLFEEAAGIRKHERRRRKAEGELAEAESNLERVRDLLSELRPQARRLQAQAEQQEARRDAGSQLATALVGAARVRLGSAEHEARAHAATLAAARREADGALADLRDAEEAATSLARALAERADAEQQLRARLDAARARAQGIRLEEARTASETQALARERTRLAEERAAAGGRAEEARRLIAAVLPEADQASEDALEAAERRLADAGHEAEDLRSGGRAVEERTAAARAARERASADADRSARRAAEAERRLAEQERLTARANQEAASSASRASAAAEAAEAARASEADADRALAAARSAHAEARAAAASTDEALASRRAGVAALAARLEHLDGQLESGPDGRTLRAARARGGRRFTEGLEVETGLRLAVEAALGDAMSGVVLEGAESGALSEAAAVVILRAAPATLSTADDRRAARLGEAVAAAGGGSLEGALRRDPDGHAGRLLARCRWVPDLADALRLREQLPPGWRLVTRDGVVVDDLGVLRPAPSASLLDLRAAREEVVRRLERETDALRKAEAQATGAAVALAAAHAHEEALGTALEAARRARRVADEDERAGRSAAQNAAREVAWQSALLERSRTDAWGASEEARQRAAELAAVDDPATDAAGGVDHVALASLEDRLARLRAERDAAARAAGEARAARDRALEQRRRAEVGLGLAQARLDELDREDLALTGREADLAAEAERLAAELAVATTEEAREAEAFEASVTSARDERGRLLAAEERAGAARERLRAAEQRSRQGEVAQMEARLQLDAAREGLLIELASIGEEGLRALAAERPEPAPRGAVVLEELSALLEHALDEAIETWRLAPVEPSNGGQQEGPARARIASLRRRFNELGASNPFAAQELAEVRGRLDSLDAQREDLERAIRETRELITRLGSLMTEQFRQTFEALEGAFGRRFEQLFGGGDAQLSLTAPDDLASTGVEITARPPGKKRQALAMLSGGERALTAVALLLAMLEVRPVPFCVLDEVDAALDEANIGRFSTALRSLAQDIQFVVITHNRGTIEAADALYGVTVGDDAVSRVVSLRLADLPEQEAASLVAAPA